MSLFVKHWVPFTQGCFMPTLVEIDLMVLQEKNLDFVNECSLFRNNLPLEKGWPFIWTNLNFLHQKMFCTEFSWNWPGDFLNFVNVFSWFPNFIPLEMVWPFMWTHFHPLHTRMLCALHHLRMLCDKFGWNLPYCSGEEFGILKFC